MQREVQLELDMWPEAWPETLLELPEKCWGPLLDSSDFQVIAEEIERDFSSDVVPLISEMLVWKREPSISEAIVYVRFSDELEGFVAAEMGRAENLLRTTKYDYGYCEHSFGETEAEAIAELMREIATRRSAKVIAARK